MIYFARSKFFYFLMIIWVAILIFLLTSCGYDGSYRYSCQDPENWGTKECEPPICEVDGNCTKTLLGWDPTETTVEVTIETIPTEETVAP
jgi:hypothetical protein